VPAPADHGVPWQRHALCRCGVDIPYDSPSYSIKKSQWLGLARLVMSSLESVSVALCLMRHGSASGMNLGKISFHVGRFFRGVPL
jgi:hypothetical protein